MPAQNTSILLHTEGNDQFILDIAVPYLCSASLMVLDTFRSALYLDSTNFLLHIPSIMYWKEQVMRGL